MSSIFSVLNGAWNYLLTIRFSDMLDILIVAYLIYKFIGLIKRTNSGKLAKGILIILLVLWLSGVFKLTMIEYILKKAVELGLIAIVIIFQPELRKFLERVGSSSLTYRFNIKNEDLPVIESTISQTVIACTQMAKDKTGALIVFERKNNLSEYMQTGTSIDSSVNAELLKNLFFINAPLHDGAVFIRDGRISAAGCVLPLSKSQNLSKELGMRHRAGIGMSEISDAVIVIVSEESGAISIAQNGMLKRHLTSDTFEKILRSALIPDSDSIQSEQSTLLSRLKKIIKGKKNEEK